MLCSGKLGTQSFEEFDTNQPYRKITAIVVHSGFWIDGLEVQFEGEAGKLHGGHNTQNETFRIPDGVYLTKIVGRVTELYLTMLQFHLSDGTVSQRYGEHGEQDLGKGFELFAWHGEVISGIHGSLITGTDEDSEMGGEYIGAIGAYIAPRPKAHP